MNIKSFGACEILSTENKKIMVSSFWKGSPVLFVFLRHFACIACRAHAVEVWKDRATFEKKGLRIIFISNGAPHFIQSFREDLNLGKAEIFTDPSLKSYDACEFHRSMSRAIGPKGILKGLKLFAQGHRQGKMEKDIGDLWQLGGIVLVNKDGKLIYQYASSSTGDYPIASEILKSL